MTAGNIYTIAGNGARGYKGYGVEAYSYGGGGHRRSGGRLAGAELDWSQGLALDASGNLYIADWAINRVPEVAAANHKQYGIDMTAGNIYTVAGIGVPGFNADGVPAGATELNEPAGLALDASGNLYIADVGNDRIREVAAANHEQYGIAMTAGDIYTVAGDGVMGLFGEMAPAATAELDDASSVALDASGNLYIADVGNDRIREVAAANHKQYGIAMTAGDIYTVAGTGFPGFSGDGGPAAAAKLDQPKDVSFDASGNLYIADSANNRIREVAAANQTQYGIAMTAGDIYTVAGDGTPGFSGDGGPSSIALLNGHAGLALVNSGSIFIADQYNNRVRQLRNQ